jgi:class 3 adenylate cyclase
MEDLEASYCYIDKTIGDEIVFILPDTENEDGVHINLKIGIAMEKLAIISKQFAQTHPFRLGLAFGTVVLVQKVGGGYKEWSMDGQTVNLAKHLHSLPELRKPSPFAGAFGMLTNDPECEATFPTRLGYITFTGFRWNFSAVQRTETFKGNTSALVATF